MTHTYFITGTDTGVGKTVLTSLLTRFLRAGGVPAAALKPICSGGRADARALHAAMNGALSLDEINTILYGESGRVVYLKVDRNGEKLKVKFTLQGKI